MIGIWEDAVIAVGDKARRWKRIGFLIVMLPTIWDIAKLGLWRFFEWRIHPKGIVVMLVGVGIIYFAEKVQRWFE